MSSIIVVDDDITMLRLVQLHLRRLGVKGHFFQNGKECLNNAESIQPALALLDYDLPDTKGTQLMRDLREVPNLKSLPVIIFTARTSTDLLPSIKQSGASAVLSKPFSPSILIRQIESFLPKK